MPDSILFRVSVSKVGVRGLRISAETLGDGFAVKIRKTPKEIQKTTVIKVRIAKVTGLGNLVFFIIAKIRNSSGNYKCQKFLILDLRGADGKRVNPERQTAALQIF